MESLLQKVGEEILPGVRNSAAVLIFQAQNFKFIFLKN